MTDREQEELLIRIDERTKYQEELLIRFEQIMTNHLRHHFRYNILAWSVALGAIISLIVKLT